MTRLREIWNGQATVVVRQLARLLVRAVARLAAMLIWQPRRAWARAGGRARVAVLLAVLILISSQTSAAAPSVSATTEGLAVLLIAGVGLWMIVTAPFRRRRW